MVVKILKMLQGSHMGLQVAFAVGYYRKDSEHGQESQPTRPRQKLWYSGKF